MHFNHKASIPLRIKHITWTTINLRKRQIMHFFSNNNSAILRKYWNDIPFQSTDFGKINYGKQNTENRLTIYWQKA